MGYGVRSSKVICCGHQEDERHSGCRCRRHTEILFIHHGYEFETIKYGDGGRVNVLNLMIMYTDMTVTTLVSNVTPTWVTGV